MSRAMFSIYNLFCLFVTFVTTANAAFSFTTSGSTYFIDTGATPSLTFQLNTTSGDILTQNFNGINYQSTTQKTQVNTGLTVFGGATTCDIGYQGTSNRRCPVILTNHHHVAYLIYRVYQSLLYIWRWQHHPVLCICIGHRCYVSCDLQSSRAIYR